MTEKGKDLLDRIKNGSTAVLGLGVSNLPLVSFLLEHGARVTARDAKPEGELTPEARTAAARCDRLITGKDYLSGLAEDVIFRSPGIRPDTPEIPEAVRSGSVLTSEAELYFELCDCKTVGITGSDGKTTTTTVTALLLCRACELSGRGGKAAVGGNIGVPLVTRLLELTGKDYIAAELSSFQLQSMTRSPEIAVITNVTPNHLNWHTGMEEYTDAKRNIYRFAPCRRLITNAANPVTAALAADCGLPVTLFSSAGKPDGGDCRVWLEGEKILYETDGGKAPSVLLRSVSDIRLPGRHNIENYMAACGVLLAEGFDAKTVAAALYDVCTGFGGVEHRLEHVCRINGADFYNSSIDSTPARTAAALSVFPDGRNVLICGGYDKNIPFEPLAHTLCDGARAVVLTGATAEKINKAITGLPQSERAALSVYREPDFDSAVRLAASLAGEGDRVLFSPACASFDAFRNFEERGERFKTVVRAIAAGQDK